MKKFLVASALVLSATGVTFIQNFENGPQGPRLEAYLDAVKIPTICTGSTKNVYLPMRVTPVECEERLVEDTTYAGKAVQRYVKVKLTQEMYDMLVSFVFNVGPGAFAKSTMLVLLNKGEYCNAGHQFKRWNKAKGKVLRGLTMRRAAEAVPFLKECK